MINKPHPHEMTTAERLDEIASILAKGIIRSHIRSNTDENREGFTGLHCEPKHACNKDNKG